MWGRLHSTPHKMNYKMIDFCKAKSHGKVSAFLGDNKIS